MIMDKKVTTSSPTESSPDRAVNEYLSTVNNKIKPIKYYSRSPLVKSILEREKGVYSNVTPVLTGEAAKLVREAVRKQLEEDEEQ